jgi:hypothetical protein
MVSLGGGRHGRRRSRSASSRSMIAPRMHAVTKMARANVTKAVSGSEVVAARADPMTMPAKITAMAMRAALLVGSVCGFETLALAVGMVPVGVRSCSSHLPMLFSVIGRLAASSRPAIPSCRSVVFFSAAGVRVCWMSSFVIRTAPGRRVRYASDREKELDRRLLEQAERSYREAVAERRSGAGAAKGDATLSGPRRANDARQARSPQVPALLVGGHPRQQRS